MANKRPSYFSQFGGRKKMESTTNYDFGQIPNTPQFDLGYKPVPFDMPDWMKQSQPQPMANPWQTSMEHVMGSGVMNPILDSIRKRVNAMHPYGSGAGDSALSEMLTSAWAQNVSPYAQQLSSQAHQEQQNFYNRAQALYQQAQALASQGRFQEAQMLHQQYMQQLQMAQQYDMWQQEFDRREDWRKEDANKPPQQNYGGGGGTQFHFPFGDPWANHPMSGNFPSAGGGSGSSGGGSGFVNPPTAQPASGGTIGAGTPSAWTGVVGNVAGTIGGFNPMGMQGGYANPTMPTPMGAPTGAPTSAPFSGGGAAGSWFV